MTALVERSSRRVARRRAAFLAAVSVSPHGYSTGIAALLYTQSLELHNRLVGAVAVDSDIDNADWIKRGRHLEHVGTAQEEDRE